MSNPVAQHKADSPQSVACAVVTVSDTRTRETDRGGDLVAKCVTAAGYLVTERQIVRDEPREIRQCVQRLVASPAQVILMTGGTGIAERDQTYETVTALFDKPLPGYGELFRMLSYQEIGPASMLSRATAGVIQKTVLMTMPGSPAAVQLAMDKIILPELSHLVQQATK